MVLVLSDPLDDNAALIILLLSAARHRSCLGSLLNRKDFVTAYAPYTNNTILRFRFNGTRSVQADYTEFSLKTAQDKLKVQDYLNLGTQAA